MNTKTAIGVLAAILILVGAFFLLHRPAVAPVLTPAATQGTTTGAAATTTPVAPIGAPAFPNATGGSHAPTVTVGAARPALVAAFNASSLTSSSSHPVITGTANIPGVGIIIDNAAGVGIVGSSAIRVSGGKWSYAVPIQLDPGTYAVHLIGGDKEVVGKLTVTQ